ncbi:S41 family peptidase [Pontibacter sp. G13]|uniref:S41 family peptidase n=1 Tax=Pontibacter sp. G13 TaxID=3074898 RepID=UPI002889BAD9|nr:S41 family peptidase [Pontibacter sp. G13]WNJ17530.1 S41 family peptidase [Pontibacter sp. G13]
MKQFLLIIIGCLAYSQFWGQCPQRIPKDQVTEDLVYLYETLESAHYDLYANCPKTTFDISLERILAELPDSLSLLEVFQIFQPFVAQAQMGHCTLEFPFAYCYGPFIQNGGKLFPMTVQVEGDRMWVRQHYDSLAPLPTGTEILEIQGQPIPEFLEPVYDYLAGETPLLKTTMLDLATLPRILWILGITPDSFALKIKQPDGVISEVKVNTINAGEFEGFMAQEAPIFSQDRDFRMYDQVAYLKPGPFTNRDSGADPDGGLSKDEAEFTSFLDTAFTQMREEGAHTLIVDLRNNPGGTNTISDHLIAYLADVPFRFCSRFSVKTSAVTKAIWEDIHDDDLAQLRSDILSHEDGVIFDSNIPWVHPRDDSTHFDGDLYFLVNRYTYSQGTVVAAMAQDFGIGKVVGEPTADTPTTYGAIHQFKLPNTQISVNYPKALVIRPNGNENHIGIQPDEEMPDNFWTPEDELLEGLLKKIDH